MRVRANCVRCGTTAELDRYQRCEACGPFDRDDGGRPLKCPLCGSTTTQGECDHCGADGLPKGAR